MHTSIASRLSDFDLSEQFTRRVGLPVVVALMAACVVAIGALLWTAARLDDGALGANRELARRVLALFERTMLRQIGDYANWDDMFEHAHLRMDEEWATDNMGPWVEEAFDIGFTFVVGPDGGTRYAWHGSARREDAVEEVLGAGFRTLLARSLGRPAGEAAVTGLVQGPDGPVLVAVDAIRRSDGSADLPAGERSTLVFGRALGGSFLDELAEATGLDGLRLVAVPRDAATLRLTAADGTPLGALGWRQEWPGRWLRHFGVPPLALLLALLALFVSTVLGRTRSALAALAESEARARVLAAHDPVTGLLNRRAFGERLEAALAEERLRQGGIAILCLDLDGFKEVNDTLGHAAGDRLLRVVASRLVSSVREGDEVARLGGDEFAVIVHGCSDAGVAARLARRLIAAIREPCRIDDQDVHVGTSIGIAVADRPGVDGGELLKQADVALYAAKDAGRGTYRFFAPEMNRALEERRLLLRDLRAALATGGLEVHYQPKLSVDGGRIVGVEALLRWDHPERGPVPPAVFVPLAEECGLIEELGEWVLERACRDILRHAGLTLAVNLSPAQFRRGDLVGRIDRILARTGFPPRRLELELTESAVFADPARALLTIDALKRRGIRIVMDDFGTGYSSLSQLHRFPFDAVKIDRSFVARLDTDDGAGAIVRAIVSLGRSLGLEVVAEGVETGAQLQHLRAVGADRAQGYATGRPMPLSELVTVLAAAAPGAPAPS